MEGTPNRNDTVNDKKERGMVKQAATQQSRRHRKNGRNPMDKGGSPGANTGEPGVGMEWTSDYHKMQEEDPNQHRDSTQRI